MDWSYSVLPTEETENAAKDPVNTDLLTASLLVAFFVATIRWLLANGHGEFRFRDAARRPSFVTAREDARLLQRIAVTLTSLPRSIDLSA